MIREIARCPYCGDVSAGVDDDRPELVMTPDRADGVPCLHLAFLSVSLEAYCSATHKRVARRTGHWLWTRGAGVRARPGGPEGDLWDYVELVACGMLAEESCPTVEYRIGGATAGVREADRPGSGEFPIAPANGQPLHAVLDGLALYSPSPETLVAEIRRLSGPTPDGAKS